MENRGKFYILRALVLNDTDSLESFKDLSREELNKFLEGLFLCHTNSCRNFFNKNKDIISKKGQRINYLKLVLKAPGHWSQKGNDLNEYLSLVKGSKNFTDVISVMQYIPNHPVLKRFLAKYFLMFKTEKEIHKLSIHLARYFSAWHNLNYKKVLNSKSRIHIEKFVKSLKIACPSNMKNIISFIKDYELARSFLEGELGYLYSRKEDIPSFLKKTNFKPILNAKCTRTY